jgi:hypothetical protein
MAVDLTMPLVVNETAESSPVESVWVGSAVPTADEATPNQPSVDQTPTELNPTAHSDTSGRVSSDLEESSEANEPSASVVTDVSPESDSVLIPWGPQESIPTQLTSIQEPMGPLLPATGPTIGPKLPNAVLPESDDGSALNAPDVATTAPTEPPTFQAPNSTIPLNSGSADKSASTSQDASSGVSDSDLPRSSAHEAESKPQPVAALPADSTKAATTTLQPSLVAVEQLPIPSTQFLAIDAAGSRVELPDVAGVLKVKTTPAETVIQIKTESPDVREQPEADGASVASLTAATLAAFEAQRKQVDESQIDLPSIAVVQMLMPIQSWLIFTPKEETQSPDSDVNRDTWLAYSRIDSGQEDCGSASEDAASNGAEDDAIVSQSTHPLLFMAIVGLLGIPQTIKRRGRNKMLHLLFRRSKSQTTVDSEAIHADTIP